MASPTDARGKYASASETDAPAKTISRAHTGPEDRPSPIPSLFATANLKRVQRYSSCAFTPFLALHATNVAIVPLVTQSVAASEPYLLLTRPFYQSPLLEPLMIFVPVWTHIISGVILRVRRWNAAQSDRRITWSHLSSTSKSGYALIPMFVGHVAINRFLPLQVEGDSSNIGLGFVSHGFALRPWLMTLVYAALITTGVWHFFGGWAIWLAKSPDQAVGKTKRLRYRNVALISTLVAGTWIGGGVGVVGRGGMAQGWLGSVYDGIYSVLPGI